MFVNRTGKSNFIRYFFLLENIDHHIYPPPSPRNYGIGFPYFSNVFVLEDFLRVWF